MKLIVKLILLFLFSAEANIKIYFGISMVFDTDFHGIKGVFVSEGMGWRNVSAEKQKRFSLLSFGILVTFAAGILIKCVSLSAVN